MKQNVPALPASLTRLSLSCKMQLAFGLCALVVVICVGSGIYLLNDQNTKAKYVSVGLAPLGDAAMEIKLTATKAHLMLEELLQGDEAIKPEAIWSMLDDTLFYTNAILSGGKNDERTFLPTQSPIVRQNIEEVKKLVINFTAAAKQRHAAYAGASGIGSGADIGFDEAYDAALTILDRTANNHPSTAAAAMEAKFALAHGHLILEEVLSGDSGESIDESINSFKSAQTQTAAIRAITGSDFGLDAAIVKIIALAEQRHQSMTENFAQSGDADTHFDQSFENFIAKADAAEEAIHKDMADNLAALENKMRLSILFLSICGAISVAIAFIMAVLSHKTLSLPLIRLTTAMNKMAQGNHDVTIDYLSRQDEIGDMARALEIFHSNEGERKALLGRENEEQATRRERAEKLDQAIEFFQKKIEAETESLIRAGNDMQGMARNMDQAISETNNRGNSVADVARKTSQNLHAVAAATEELTSSIQEISRNVSETATTARNCSDAAHESQQTLDRLQKAVAEIDIVISSINEVAEQTNLLALNATIEASRAGEAGRGFAVVAGEVKILASQTHKMTEDIAKKVADIKKSANQTIASVQAIMHQINTLDDKTSGVAAAVEQQNATTSEISRSAGTVSSSMDDVMDNISYIQKASSTSSSSCGLLKDTADDLSLQADEMRSTIRDFLRTVREA